MSPHFADADLIVAADGINSTIRTPLCRRISSRTSTSEATSSSGSARIGCSRRSRSYSSRPSTAGSRRMPIASMHDTSTFIVETTEPNWRARWPRSARCRRYDRLLRAIVRALAGGPPADDEHEPSAWFAMALLPARHQPDMGDGQRRADGRCGAYRAFLDRVWHQACAGGCDRAGTRLRYPRHRRAGRSCGLRGRAQGRRAAHPVRGAQLDRMVRERGTLRPPGTGAIRLLPAYAQPAHKPRESPPARSDRGSNAWSGWLAGRVGHPADRAVPPMFLPFQLREMRLANRVVVSPMATYSARDGMPNDFHLVHLGARALGGAGLVFTEMVCVTPQGRITPGCAGL